MLLNFSAREVMAKLEHQSAQRHSYKGVISFGFGFFPTLQPQLQYRHVGDELHYSHRIILMALECHCTIRILAR